MPRYEKEVRVEGKSLDQIYQIVAAGIERFLAKTPVGQHELDFDPSNHTIDIKSSMLTATLFCFSNGIKLEGNLSIMAMPFRSKLDEGIDRWIQKNFEPENPA